MKQALQSAAICIVFWGGLIALVTMSSCSGERSTQAAGAKPARPPTVPPFVAATVTLPSGDGRVHIISIPGRYGSSECAVVVTPAGSSISCPSAIEAGTDSPPSSTASDSSGHEP